MKDFATLYRPNTWSQIVGQEVLVTTLQSQIFNNNVAHAYLFCGPRGTGKTTTAKVFANALQAQIIEIDAASNNGVDHIRNLKQDVLYLPVDNKKYKVYIIDECHMMSQGAFNAFLKLLEEPPAHVIFILCTTDPQKLPNTIISRCQRFDLKRIDSLKIVGRLRTIADDEQINIQQEALHYIAKSVDGGMRDAIKLLQKCASLSNEVTVQTVIEALGSANLEHLETMYNYIIAKDIANVLKYFNKMISDGLDIKTFVSDLIQYLTDKVSEKVSNNDFKINSIMNIIDELVDLANELKYSNLTKTLTELKLIKLCINNEVLENTSNIQTNEHSTSAPQINFDNSVLTRVLETLDRYEKRFIVNEMEIDMLKRRR